MTSVCIKNKMSATQEVSHMPFPAHKPPSLPRELNFYYYCFLVFFIAYYFCIPKQCSLILYIFKLHIMEACHIFSFCVLLFYSALCVCVSHPCCCTKLNSFLFNCYLVYHLNPCYCYWTSGLFPDTLSSPARRPYILSS